MSGVVESSAFGMLSKVLTYEYVFLFLDIFIVVTLGVILHLF